MKFHFRIMLLILATSSYLPAQNAPANSPTNTWYNDFAGNEVQATPAQATATQVMKNSQAARAAMDSFDKNAQSQLADIQKRLDKAASVGDDWSQKSLLKEKQVIDTERAQEQKLRSMTPQDLAAYFKDPAKNADLDQSLKQAVKLEKDWRVNSYDSSAVANGVVSSSKDFENYLNFLKKAYQGADPQHLDYVSNVVPAATPAVPSTKASPVALVTPTAAPVVKAAAVRKVASPSVASPTNAAASAVPAATTKPATNITDTAPAPVAASAVSLAPAVATSAAPAVPAPGSYINLSRSGPSAEQGLIMGDGPPRPPGFQGTPVPVSDGATSLPPNTALSSPAPAAAKTSGAPGSKECLGLQFPDDSLKKAGVDGKKAASLKENECVPGSYSVAPCQKRYYYDPEISGKQCLQVCRHYIFNSGYTQDIYNSDIASMLDNSETKEAAKMLLSIEGMDEQQMREQMNAANAPSDSGRVPYRNATRPVISDSAEKLQLLAVALNKSLPQDKTKGNYCDQIASQSKTVIAQAEKGKDNALTSTSALKGLAPDNYDLHAQCTNPNGDVAALKIKHFFSSDEMMVVNSVKDAAYGHVTLDYQYWDVATKTWKSNVMLLQTSQNPSGLVDDQGNHLDLHQISANSLPNKAFCGGSPSSPDSSGAGTASNGPGSGTTGPGIK